MRFCDYVIRMGVEVLDAGLVDDLACPDCHSEVARVTYAVTRRRLGSSSTEVVSVNDVLACADEDLCGWSIPLGEAVV